jgi:hypothetical protein
MLGRELFPQSPVSPQRGPSDDRSPVVASPSSVTLKGVIAPHSRTQSRRSIDAGPSTLSRANSLASDPHSPGSGPSGPRVVIRQPSSILQQPSSPPTTSSPLDVTQTPPEGAQRADFPLLPAFLEHAAHSATSSSSSLSFASSASSKFDTLETEGHRRSIRQFKDARKTPKSRSPSPLKDASRDVQDPPSRPSSSRREFSPTRTLKKAISIQNIPKKAQASGASSSPAAAEDPKLLKKQRSFHHTLIPVHSLIPVPPLPASLKQASSSNVPFGRDASLVPEERRASVQPSQKPPSTSSASSPMHVRRRLFSGTSLRRSLSSQSAEPDDDLQSILSLSSPTLPSARPHTAIPVNRPPVPNRSDPSSFWDEEFPTSPATVDVSRDHTRKHILSAADILKFENMVRDGENLNKFRRSRGDSFSSYTTCKQSVRTAPSSATSVKSFSPPSAMRYVGSSGDAVSGRSTTLVRSRTRGNSLQGRVVDVMNGRPHATSPVTGQTTRSLSFQSLHALQGLPVPPRIRSRMSTSSGATLYSAENPASALFTPGERSSIVITPLSPPPVRRSPTGPTRRMHDPATGPPAALKPGISRRPSFLDMKDDVDQESPPPEDSSLDDSFLDMGKASLDTVRSADEYPDPATSDLT